MQPEVLQPPTLREWREILRRDPCAYCGRPTQDIDHITPARANGCDEPDNLIGLCRRCNRRKKCRTVLAFMLNAPIGPNPEYHERGIHYDFGYEPPEPEPSPSERRTRERYAWIDRDLTFRRAYLDAFGILLPQDPVPVRLRPPIDSWRKPA